MRASWSALRRWWNLRAEGEGVRELAGGEAIRLPSFRKGSSLWLESGVVVVTREGDRRDHVLEAGSELQLPRRGRVVAWAMEASRIEVRRRNAALADWRTARLIPPAESGPVAQGRAPRALRERQPREQRAPPPPRAGSASRSSATGRADR